VENNDNYQEMLVLSDESGNYFAIPFGDLEHYRVSEEQRAQIGELLGSDVSGYNISNPYLLEDRAHQLQADRQHEAEQARLRNLAKENSESSPKVLHARGLFTGVVATLKLISRPASKQA
jgi:hypothetical protein